MLSLNKNSKTLNPFCQRKFEMCKNQPFHEKHKFDETIFGCVNYLRSPNTQHFFNSFGAFSKTFKKRVRSRWKEVYLYTAAKITTG